MEYIEGIAEFQIIQKRRDKFLIKIVKSNGFSNNHIPKIEEIIKSGCLGEEVDVEVKIVDRIERGETGKLKYVISIV